MENYRIGGVSVGHIKPNSGAQKSKSNPEIQNNDFVKQLGNSLKNLTDLKFSGHAIERLADRGVQMTGDRARRLQSAVNVARQKGSRDSLVLLDELAFVVSIKNSTVITACDTQSVKDGVFTKIDSTIFG